MILNLRLSREVRKRGQVLDLVFGATVAQSLEDKNVIRPGTPLPPREDAARRVNVTTDIKIATMHSILFQLSTLASAPWHKSLPFKAVNNK